MPSLQNAAPGSKSSKFKNLDPLAPFTIQPDDELEEVEETVTEATDGRMRTVGRVGGIPASAMPHCQPSMPFRTQQQQQQQQQQETVPHGSQMDGAGRTATSRHTQHPGQNDIRKDDSSFDDSELDDDDDDDPAMEAFRKRRLQELKRAQIEHNENVAKGHTEVRTIKQDDFLPECTGSSEFVCVHFFHNEFERCKIMDMHLKRIVSKHSSCKFLRIDAEKAPFFVAKLKVQTLPSLLVFQDGQVVDRLVGFEGLSKSASRPDEFPTRRLEQWLHGTGAINYKPSDDDSETDDSEDDIAGSNARYGRLGLLGRAHERSRRYDEDF